MTYLINSYYFKGAQLAHYKLGTVAGPIPYATSDDPEPLDITSLKNTQREFKGLDEHNRLLETTKNADYIRGDLDKVKPQRDEIRRSTINQAFDTNNAIGEELGLGDPGFTQPHGSDKVAFNNPLAGGSSPFSAPQIKMPGIKTPSQLVPKVQAPITPGINLKNSVTQTSLDLNTGASNLSRQARGNGNPF